MVGRISSLPIDYHTQCSSVWYDRPDEDDRLKRYDFSSTVRVSISIFEYKDLSKVLKNILEVP